MNNPRWGKNVALTNPQKIWINEAFVTVYDGDWTRFMSNVEIAPEGCWNWTGYCWGRNGRPAFGLPGGQITAARVAHAWKKGPVSSDMECCHTCDNEMCVNPDHIFLGTHEENMKDMKEKGRHVSGWALHQRRKAQC